LKKAVKIPIVDLSREYLALKQDIQKSLKHCFKSQEWILNSKVAEFEERVAKYLGVRFAIGVASGTDALLLSLRALAMDLKRKTSFDSNDEVITTPFTFVATAEAILRSGARPVFVDIDPDTFNINPEEIKKAITKNTVGILPVHLYGLCCDMEKVLKIAKEYNLFVVEDAAQAFGAQFHGKKSASFADLGTLSFYPSKNLGAWGDAGMAVTGNKSLAENVRVLRNHGQRTRYNADFIGYNSRLDSIQASVLSAKLRYIDKFTRLRRKVASNYTKALGDIKYVQPPLEPMKSLHVYNLYTIKVSMKRDKLLNFLNSKGIGARIYYPLPLYEMKAFKSAKCKGDFKATKDVLSKIISLPMHPFLKNNEISYIIRAIRKFFKMGREL